MIEIVATTAADNKIVAKNKTTMRISVDGDPTLKTLAVFSIQLNSLWLEFWAALKPNMAADSAILKVER